MNDTFLLIEASICYRIYTANAERLLTTGRVISIVTVVSKFKVCIRAGQIMIILLHIGCKFSIKVITYIAVATPKLYRNARSVAALVTFLNPLHEQCNWCLA